MKTTIKVNGLEFSFCDEDIANPDDMVAQDEYNPHGVRGWLLHDHGFTVCVVFADSLQDAIDEAVDCGKMDRYLIDDASIMDYLTDNPDEIAPGFDAENDRDWETVVMQ